MKHPRKKLLAALAALALLPGAVWAQNGGGQAFSLSQAKSYAVEHNIEYKNAALDVDASRQKVNEITAIGLPQVSGSASFQSFIDIPVQLIPAAAFDPTAPADLYVPVQFGIDNTLQAGLTVNQLVFDGTYIVGLQSAKTYVSLSEKMRAKSAIDIKDRVASAYYGVLAMEESIKALKDNLNYLESTLQETKAIAEQGLMDETEADQMELTVGNVRNMLASMERQREVAYKSLKYSMGMPLTSEITLSETLSDLVGESAANAASADPKVNLGSHVDYQLAATQEELMKLNMKKEKYTRLPSLGGYFSYSRSSFSNEFDFADWYPSTLWGLQLNVPIFDSFGTHNKIKQAKIEVEKAENNREMLEQALQIQAESAQEEYLTALANYNHEKSNLQLSNDILRKTVARQQSGMASSLEVSTANAQYLTTQNNVVAAQLQLLNAKAKLASATGNYN